MAGCWCFRFMQSRVSDHCRSWTKAGRSTWNAWPRRERQSGSSSHLPCCKHLLLPYNYSFKLCLSVFNISCGFRCLLSGLTRNSSSKSCTLPQLVEISGRKKPIIHLNDWRLSTNVSVLFLARSFASSILLNLLPRRKWRRRSTGRCDSVQIVHTL